MTTSAITTTAAVVMAGLTLAAIGRRHLAGPGRTMRRPGHHRHRPRAPIRLARRRSAAISPAAHVVGVIVAAVLAGPWLAAFVPVVTWARRRAIPLLARRRDARQVESATPETIELLVLFVHAGLTPHQSVRSMAERAPPATRPGFTAVVERLDRGVPLADALAELPARLGPGLASVSDTLGLAVRHGTPIAEALTQLSADARARRQRLAEAEARQLPVRLSFPLVFCTLPSFVLVAIAPAVLAAISSLGDTAW